MPTAHTVATLFTLSTVNIKATVKHLTRDLDLILMLQGLVGELCATTLRTRCRQGRVVNLIYAVRNGAPFVLAVALTGFPSRRLRIGLGGALGEGCGLSFSRPSLSF